MPTGGRSERARAKLFGLGLGAAITFGMSVVIYLTAYALRLPRERVERMLATTAGNP